MNWRHMRFTIVFNQMNQRENNKNCIMYIGNVIYDWLEYYVIQSRILVYMFWGCVFFCLVYCQSAHRFWTCATQSQLRLCGDKILTSTLWMTALDDDIWVSGWMYGMVVAYSLLFAQRISDQSWCNVELVRIFFLMEYDCVYRQGVPV